MILVGFWMISGGVPEDATETATEEKMWETKEIPLRPVTETLTEELTETLFTEDATEAATETFLSHVREERQWNTSLKPPWNPPLRPVTETSCM